MAQVDQSYTPAYTKDELRFNLLRGSFANAPHDFYIVYDDAIDQIIVRLVEPKIFASEYYVTDETALLVRDDDREAVGFTIINFESEYLEKVPQLAELWTTHKLAEYFRQYRKYIYEPESKKITKSEISTQRIAAYTANESKAAAVLVYA